MNGLEKCQEDDVSSFIFSASSAENEFDFEKYLYHKEEAKYCHIEKDSFKPIWNKISKFLMHFSPALLEIRKFKHSSKVTEEKSYTFICILNLL